ncbi:unnamed protein product [Anisakis simplex]|uniref:Putative rab-2,4,14 (inferred by orthology to a S. mansoni protein) n=1 Tax=Anisakis simplex TaxID=6269 RepID=A0A0M3K4W7_ANISI|nr:unnamed protein product [Anisakis simplex]
MQPHSINPTSNITYRSQSKYRLKSTNQKRRSVADYLLKFLIIGNAGTGKSCIMHQFVEKKFKADSTHTIGVEFGSRMVVLGGKKVKLQIWDTAGQERRERGHSNFFWSHLNSSGNRRGEWFHANGRICSRESYNALQQWLVEARNLASSHIVVILVGNKKDLHEDRQVMLLEASQFAQENDLTFMETSALNGENVEETFLKCAKTILSKIESGEIDIECVGAGVEVGSEQLRKYRDEESRRQNRWRYQECSSSCRNL